MAEEAGKKENENSVNQKPQTEPLTVEAPKKKKHGCLMWFGILAGIYILLTLWMQWTPPVRGVVVDAETGEPIPGVEIIRQGNGGAISGIGIVSTAGCKQTHENGRFSIWGTLESTMSTWWSYFVPIWSIERIQLYIYHPDYVTSFTEVEIGRIGLTDRIVCNHESFEEGRVLYESMRFKIKLAKPKTERDWSEKCGQAVRSYMEFQDHYGVDGWLFNDLVGYLERYPRGEKAWDYFTQLFPLTGGDYERRDIKTAYLEGKYTKKDVEEIYRRNKKLIELSEKVKEPDEYREVVDPGLKKTRNWERKQREKGIEERKQLVVELEKVLFEKQNKVEKIGVRS
jgi:hypothetical protein